MNTQIPTKINQLLEQWPQGTIAVHPWLRQHGINQDLATAYKRRGWLKSIGQGAYARFDDKTPSWKGGLHAIQTQLGLPIHVGASSALDLQGYGHFISPEDKAPVWLFGPQGSRLPLWFKKRDWGLPLYFEKTDLFAKNPSLGMSKLNMGAYPLQVSAPERAYMELLHLLPTQSNFEAADTYGESLSALRPKLILDLLEACASIKVRRLFLFMAQRHAHPWFEKLDPGNINLGSGKRVIAKVGAFDPQYKITVPKSYLEKPHVF